MSDFTTSVTEATSLTIDDLDQALDAMRRTIVCIPFEMLAMHSELFADLEQRYNVDVLMSPYAPPNQALIFPSLERYLNWKERFEHYRVFGDRIWKDQQHPITGMHLTPS